MSAGSAESQPALESLGLGLAIAMWFMLVDVASSGWLEGHGHGPGLVLFFGLPLYLYAVHRARRGSNPRGEARDTDRATLVGVAGTLTLVWGVFSFGMETRSNRGDWSGLHALISLGVGACILLAGYWVYGRPLPGSQRRVRRRGMDLPVPLRHLAILLGSLVGGFCFLVFVGLVVPTSTFGPSYGLLTTVGLATYLLVLPWIVFAARASSVEGRTIFAMRMTFFGVVALAVMDAFDNMLIYSVVENEWKHPYAACAFLFGIGVMAVAPRRENRRWVGWAGVFVIAGWAAVLPWVPWSPEKLLAMRLRGIEGAPLEDAIQRLASYGVWIEDPDRTSDMHPRTHEYVPRLGDLDVSRLRRHGSVDLGGYFHGGGFDYVDGRVTRLGFSFD